MHKISWDIRPEGHGRNMRKLSGINSILPVLAVLIGFGVLPLSGFAMAEESRKSTAANGVGTEFELMFWETVANSNDKAQLEAYLQQYPAGTFAALARIKIAALDNRSLPVAAASPVAMPTTPAPAAPAPVAAPVAAISAAPEPASPVPAALSAAVAMPVTALPAPSQPAATAPAAPPAPAPAPSVQSVPASDAAGLSAQLRALGQSQGVRGSATAANPVAIPPRPVLASLVVLDLPSSFCTATQRNAFYDSMYSPAIAIADANNQVAIAHMAKLQQAFDEAKAKGDFVAANLFVAEAKDYEAVAKAAYAARSSYDTAFTQFMAIPITPCAPNGGK